MMKQEMLVDMKYLLEVKKELCNQIEISEGR